MKKKQIEEGKWIHRYDGEEVSLLIEIIGEAPTHTGITKKVKEIHP